ncbi:MAG: sugar nucleotide-binding protein, partial [Gallionella sp.]
GGGRVKDLRTCNLLAALSSGTLSKQLIYISTSGVYGDCAGDYVSETRPVNPMSSRAQLRVDAEKQIRAWAKRTGARASILRVPGIYAHDRLPLDRLRAGSPAIAAIEDGYSNHIHADDLARIVVTTLRYGKASRVYHTVDEDEMKMGDYFDAVADAFDLPRPPRLPRDEVRQKVSPMMWSFMNESRRMTDTRMKRELKVRLLYPTVSDTLESHKL